MAERSQKEIKADEKAAWNRLNNHILTCPKECDYGNGSGRCVAARSMRATWVHLNKQVTD